MAIGITGYLAWSTLVSDVYYWTNAARALESATLVTCPLWVGVLAWAGHSDRGSGARLIRTLSARSTAAQPVAVIGAGAVYAAGTHLIITAMMVLNFVVHDPWGPVPVLHFAGPVFALGFACAFGYVAGRAIPSIAAVPFAAIGFYVVFTWLSLRESSLRLLTPSYDQIMIVWYGWSPGLLARHIALLVSATTALVAGAAFLNSRRWLPAACLSTALAATVASAILITANGPGYLDTSAVAPFEYHCSGTSPQICTHPAFAAGTDAIAMAVAPYAQRLAGTPGQVDRLEQRPRGLGSEPSPRATAFFLDSLSRTDIDGIVPELVTYLVDVDACVDAYETSVEPNPSRLSDMISAYLVTGEFGVTDTTGIEAQNEWLDGLDPSELRTWLADHFESYRTCQLTESDFR